MGKLVLCSTAIKLQKFTNIVVLEEGRDYDGW